MPQWTDHDIVGSYNNQRTLEIDAERTVNMFEYIDPRGKKGKTLLPTSGLVNQNIVFGGTVSGGFRAQFTFLGFDYCVIGNSFVRLDANNVVTFISGGFPLITSSGYVGFAMTTNPITLVSQILLVDGVRGYVYNVTTGVWTNDVHATDANFPTTPIDVCVLDGFFVVGNGGTPNFVLSQIYDPLTWTPLQQAAITSDAGNVRACRVLFRRLFLFSDFFTEVWENTGQGANLPFRPNRSLLMLYGTTAPASVEVAFDRMIFLSQSVGGQGSVMQVTGTQSIPISTRALDYQISQYAALGQVSDADGILIKEKGLIFYRLNFTAANHTFVYNVSISMPEQGDSEKRWHEEETLVGNRHPAQTHAYFNGNNYYGDYKEPFLYIADPTVSDNAGENIRRMRIGRPIVPSTYQRTRIDRYHLDILQGSIEEVIEFGESIELLTESGSDILTELGSTIDIESSDNDEDDNTMPPVFLSYSKDGGQSYGAKLTSYMGRIGERSARTVWRKLGVIPRGQAFVPKIEFFNDIPFIILGASWVYEIMPE